MTKYHHFSASFAKKQALSLLCMLCLAASTAWAQSIQLQISKSDPTTVDSVKVYDGTTSTFILHTGALVGVDSNHANVSVIATANFRTPYVESLKWITVSYTLVGSDSIYYLAPMNDSLPGAIVAKQLSVQGTTIDTAKVYNRGTLAPITSPGTLVGVVDSEDVHLSAIARFDDPNVGTGKNVTVVYSLYGSAAGNYVTPANTTFTSSIVARTVYAPTASVATSKEYDGTILCNVTDPGVLEGILDGDTVYHRVTASYGNPNAGILKPISVYHFLYGPQGANYSVVDTSISQFIGSIIPRVVVAEGGVASIVKTYDGTNTANVIAQAVATNILENDSVVLNTTAYFDTPEVGEGKTVYLHFTITEGHGTSNYAAPADVEYSTNGKILAPTVIDTTVGFHGLLYTDNRYCQGTQANVSATIIQGSPTYYALRFSDEALAQGFTNKVVPVALNSEDNLLNISFDIPSTCREGNYSVTIAIGNEANDEILQNFDFSVNMPNTYLVKVFNDVVSIDNRDNRFNTYQWFLNGVLLEGATKAYYQDPRGYLDGDYSLLVNKGTDDEHLICAIHFDEANAAKSVNACPNPVMNVTKVKIAGFENDQHVLTVFNSYGASILRTTFNGNEYEIDMTAMPQGTYMINVDGITTKAVKL